MARRLLKPTKGLVKMNIGDLGGRASSFGLLKCDCMRVAMELYEWKHDIGREWDFDVKLDAIDGSFREALSALGGPVVPVPTKFLLWPINEDWVLFLDNFKLGTDPSAISVMSNKLGVEAIRAVMASDRVNPVEGRVVEYGGTILEVYSTGAYRRTVSATNDGGRWSFWQSGVPFPFENTDAYKLRSIKQRFTHEMLLEYLKGLGVDLTNGISALDQPGRGYLVSIKGKFG